MRGKNERLELVHKVKNLTSQFEELYHRLFPDH